MGDILGIGVTHYPGLIQPDQQMAGLLDRTLNSDQVPEAMKDPARWPEPMRKEWADPLAAAKEHRRRLDAGGQPDQGRLRRQLRLSHALRERAAARVYQYAALPRL